MGYTTYFIQESKSVKESQTTECKSLENEFYKIHCNTNGTISIYDKQKDQMYYDVLLLEDGSDDGDGYDYSPTQEDCVFLSNDVEADIRIYKTGYKTKATIAYDFGLPKDLEARKQRKIDDHIHVQLEIVLTEKSTYIGIQAHIDNKVKDHRLRILIPSGIQGKMSVSDHQFGMIKRPVFDDAMRVWEKEEWSERPDSIYPMLSYVAIEHSHIAAITNSMREYEVIGEKQSILALTLYRSVGFLGKENLVRRPGRPSGIKLETPDSQLLKEMTFDFALTTYQQEEDLSLLAKEYLTPLISYNKMPYNAMKLNVVDFHTPYVYSLFAFLKQNVTLSTLKKAENEDALLFRVFNTKPNTQTLALNIPCEHSVNLNEEPIDFDNYIKHNQVKSFLLKKL